MFANNTDTVGAGLPAKTAAQSTSMSPDPPPSRASPLPQRPKPNTRLVEHWDQTVGASLLAMRPYQPPSQASLLPQRDWRRTQCLRTTPTLWERACPRRRRRNQHRCRLTHRHRGQARSHRFRRYSGIIQILDGAATLCRPLKASEKQKNIANANPAGNSQMFFQSWLSADA
ncbi:hypothetical protein AB7M22_003252 [Pseudomonas sp. ADAK2 TE3594]